MMDFVSVFQSGLSFPSAQEWAVLLLLVLTCIALLVVARRSRSAGGRMLRRWVIYQGVLPLILLALAAFLNSGTRLADLITRVFLAGRGLLALFVIAGILVGFALFKHGNSLRSRR